jgi:hypothetical protein
MFISVEKYLIFVRKINFNFGNELSHVSVWLKKFLNKKQIKGAFFPGHLKIFEGFHSE